VDGTYATHERKRNAYKVWWGNLNGRVFFVNLQAREKTVKEKVCGLLWTR